MDTVKAIEYLTNNEIISGNLKNIDETINNVRTIVKLFRKLPLKNEMLQNYVKAEYHSE